jgi:hypothetical protein
MLSPGEDENDPYTRWQGFRITQLGLCIALFLTFSVATLGFSVNLLVQPKYAITACVAKLLFLFSGIFGLLSVACGFVACLTRLADFRRTARVARHRADSSKAADVARWRESYKRLGKWTWVSFRFQLALFVLQELFLILSLGITYWPRLA